MASATTKTWARAAHSPSRTAESLVAKAVRDGLTHPKKHLPAWLFYDDAGSRIYEEITRLPEYYPCRAERSIFEEQARAIVAAVRGGDDAELRLVELGAGVASKTQIVASAVVEAQGATTFLATDVSAAPLEEARERFAREEPSIDFRTFVGHHEDALVQSRALGGKRLVMFVGSSIGNYDAHEARALVRAIRGSLDGAASGGALLLGTDLRKDPRVLVPAYDDAQGVTAAFNKNVLARVNRELGGGFDLARFRHVALWNDGLSRIEMHLESTCDQVVRIDGLNLAVPFRRGERIHTESSVKYDDAMIDGLFGATGFARERTFTDGDGRFAVHLARAI